MVVLTQSGLLANRHFHLILVLEGIASPEMVAYLNHVQRDWHLDLLIVLWIFFLYVQSDTLTSHVQVGMCQYLVRKLQKVSCNIAAPIQQTVSIGSPVRGNDLIAVRSTDLGLEKAIRTSCLWNSSVA